MLRVSGRRLGAPGNRHCYAASAGPQPSAFRTRLVDAGYFASKAAGRTGRRTNSPPQLGQTPPRTVVTQSAQNVHSKVQIIASGLSGGRSRSQHSQLGLRSSMVSPDRFGQGAIGKVAFICLCKSFRHRLPSRIIRAMNLVTLAPRHTGPQAAPRKSPAQGRARNRSSRAACVRRPFRKND